MKITHRAVSKEFRELLATTFPKLGNNQAYWLLLSYLLFGINKDEETDELIISAPLLADIESKTRQWESNNYTGEVLLKTFKRDILPSLEWSGYSPTKGKARTVTQAIFPERLLSYINEERENKYRKTDLVYIHNGSNLTQAKQLRFLHVSRQKALALTKKAHCQEQKDLLHYMNRIPSNRFYSMVHKNFSSAIEEAKKTEDSINQINILNTVFDQCQPFYTPVEDSTRIYSFSENLLMLKKSVKQKLLPDLVEVDLKSAQLAIAGKLWEVPEVQDFLGKKNSIWVHLAELYNLPLTADLKNILKESLYSTMYGMWKPNIAKKLKEIGHKPFFSSPIIKALFREREKQLKTIRELGGARNCFGKIIILESNGNNDDNAKSILAQLSQAYELKLLYPVVELAIAYPNEFTILLWQHDGFSWVAGRASIKNKCSMILSDVVYESAKELGILTSLETAYNPDKSELVVTQNY